MNVTLDSAPRCQISPDGSHIMMGDWTTTSNTSASGCLTNEYRSTSKNSNLQSVGGGGQQSKGGSNNASLAANNALSSAINSNLNAGQGGGSSSLNKTNYSAEEVFLNSIKFGGSSATQGTTGVGGSSSHGASHLGSSTAQGMTS